MKLFLSLIFTMLLSFSAMAGESVTLEAFLNAKWGQTQQEIHSRFNTTINPDGTHSSFHSDEFTETTIVFEFIKNELESVLFITHVKTLNPSDVIRFCDGLARSIARRHGEPEQGSGTKGDLILSWTGPTTDTFLGCKTEVPGGTVFLLKRLPVKTLP